MGCNREYAIIDKQKRFCAGGMQKSHVSESLASLISARVVIERAGGLYKINEQLYEWKIKPCAGYNSDAYGKLIGYNIRMPVTRLVTEVPETGTKSSQSGNSQFPNWELKVPETVTKKQAEANNDATSGVPKSNYERQERNPTTKELGMEIFKTEEEIEIEAKRLRDHGVDPGSAYELAANVETEEIHRQVRQIRMDYDKGQRFASSGALLAWRIRNRNPTPDYPA